MSYASIGPDVYKTYQPDGPWRAGSKGWSRPFWPGWAQNPNLVGPPRKAVQGLGCGSGGCGCGCKGSAKPAGPTNGVGAYYPSEALWTIPQGVGSYYERVANLPVGAESEVVPVSSGPCPKGYHSAKAATIQDAVQIESDVCVKEQRWLYAGLGAIAGVVFAKLVL